MSFPGQLPPELAALLGIPAPPPVPGMVPPPVDPMMMMDPMMGPMQDPILQMMMAEEEQAPEPEAGAIEAMPGGLMEEPHIPTPRTERIKGRIKDYELKKANNGKRPRAPEVGWIIEEKNRREGYWGSRNKRMEADLALYNLSEAMEEADQESGEEVVVRTTPKAMVNKLSFMVGRQKDKIECRPRGPGPKWEEAAQNVEDFLYTLRSQANMAHQSRLRMSLGRDEAWFAAVRGWVVSRIYLEPGEEFPVCIELYDPINCYPQMGKSGPGMVMDMIYYEQTTVGSFISKNPWAKRNSYIKSLASDTTIKHTWYEDEYWSIILVDDEVIRKVHHDYGFCPWVVSIAGGNPLETDDFRHLLGEGMLTSLRYTMKQQDRFLSKLMAGVNRYGNPTVIKTKDSNQQGEYPKDFNPSPGGQNETDLGKGQGYTFPQIMAPPLETQLIWEALEEDIAKAGLVPVLWGTPEGLASGFHQAVAVNAAEDALFPITDCIVQHRQWQNRLALNCVLVGSELGVLEKSLVEEDDGDQKEGIAYNKRPRGAQYEATYGKDGKQAGVRRRKSPTIGVLSIDDIHVHGVGNEVRLRRMTPQDQFQAVQAGAMASEAGLLDLDYIRGEWLDVDDPNSMNLRVIFDQIYRNEEMMNDLWMPMALQAEPAVYNFYMSRQKKRKAQEAAAQGGMMGGGGMPPNISGMPTAQLPAQMQMSQQVPQTAAGMNALIPELAGMAPPPGY